MVKGKIIEKEDVVDNVENKLLKDLYGEIQLKENKVIIIHGNP